MSTSTIDYDALAAQHGGSAAIDYDALAAQHGGSASGAPANPMSSVAGATPGMQSPEQVAGIQKPTLHGTSVDYGKVLAIPDAALGVAKGLASTSNMINRQAMGAPTPDNPLYVHPSNEATPEQQQQRLTPQNPAQKGGYIAEKVAEMLVPAPKAAEVGGAIGERADAAAGRIREAALGNPNAAALKGLHVSPQSPKAVATLSAVEGSRPFLEGVQGLKDLQARIPVAKQEIWEPYQKAIDLIGDNKVKGPDGTMTTVGELEQRRLELSAQLRTLRAGGPEATALAQQKGLTQASLMREESMVKSALDPHLKQVGIDPVAIRKAFGQVSAVGGRIAGKTTVGETAQPSGFGRMTNVQLDTPRTWIGEPVQGVRDLVAGRPAWSSNPTDLNIREAFRMGGPRPDFGTPMQASPPVGQLLLPAKSGGPTILPYYPEMGSDEKLVALMHMLRERSGSMYPKP